MAEDSDLERTESPSPRRLEEARRKGQVPRSHELAIFIGLFSALLTFITIAPAVAQGLRQIMERTLSFNKATLADPMQLPVIFLSAAKDALVTMAPLMGISVAAALLPALVMGGWLFTLEPLQPNFGKLNPFAGIARIFSVHSLVEMIKAVLKSVLIGGVAGAVIWHERADILQLVVMPLEPSFLGAWEIIRYTLLMVTGSLLVIVAIDVPFQLWDYYRNLRMTKEEVRQEMKEQEGDPQIKAKIRQLQRERARRRMMSEIPKADVVVTNPTHYAVALKYDSAMAAPKVIAKGSFLLAERIIDIARDNKVTVVRTPPLARALYHNTELGDEIPARLYTAAAEVLAYVYQLRHFQRYGGLQPNLSETLPVPEDMDPESGL